jgi:hypothetical protein
MSKKMTNKIVLSDFLGFTATTQAENKFVTFKVEKPYQLMKKKDELKKHLRT